MTPSDTPALYPANMAGHGPLRSLTLYLADLQARYDALPMTSPARGALAGKIRAVEAEIDARSGELSAPPTLRSRRGISAPNSGRPDHLLQLEKTMR